MLFHIYITKTNLDIISKKGQSTPAETYILYTITLHFVCIIL